MNPVYLKRLGRLIFLFLALSSGSFKVTTIAQAEPNRDLKELIIVFKTHFDNGYTELSETVLQKYASTLIGGALKGIEQTASFGKDQQFAWTLSGYPMKEILRRNEELRPKVSEAIRNGRFAVHALPFTFETEAMTPELLVRGFSISDEIARTHGLDLPTDAKLTDVPSHSWILPTVLTQAGVKFLHIGCNPASRSPEVPLIFWWEGPDESRLMTIYWGGYYGTDLVPPAGWTHKSWLAIIHTNDNSGAPPPEEIKATLAKARELAPNAHIRVGRMSDFYDAIIKENPELPVVRGDMPDTWIHGYFSMPKEYRDYSKTLKELRVIEAIGATMSLADNSRSAANPTISTAYEELLLFSEHTFGMAMSHGHSGIWRYDQDFAIHRAQGDYELIEQSWKEKGNHVFEAQRITVPALEKELGRLAASVKTEGSRVVVYNPLPYARSGPVEIRTHSSWHGIKGLKDATTGEIIPCENKDNVYRFIAKEVPGMGYRTYVPAPAEKSSSDKSLGADPKTGKLENTFLAVTIDPKSGQIKSILDKETGREMVNTDSNAPFGGYLYQYFDKKQVETYAKAYIKGGWDWAPAELGRPNLDDRPGYIASGINPDIKWEITSTRASVAAHFTPSAKVPHSFTLIYNLYPDRPGLEIIWSIDSKPAQPWPEGGWISFPFRMNNPEFRVGRLGGIVNPKTDFIKGTNFDYYMADRGVALFGPDGSGFAVTSPDAPAISLDRPGLWTWTGDFIPQKANVYFNLYNNQWSTNFTEWIEGSWSARFYVWPFRNYDPASSLAVPAEDFSTPFQSIIASGKGGNLPLLYHGIEVSHKSISVTAFAPHLESEGYLLRLWESAGKTENIEVSLPEGSNFRRATPVDLRGRNSGESIPVKNGKLSLVCQANRPVTLVLTK